MDYVKLGNSGLDVSPLFYGLALTIGTEVRDVIEVKRILDCVIDSGVNSFDLSSNYGDGYAETLFGNYLVNSGINRNSIVVSTKVGWPTKVWASNNQGLGRKYILSSFNESIKRMRLDYVDILFAHRHDSSVDTLEYARTFNDLIRNSKILYWGVSEWPIEAIENLLIVCERYNLEKPIVDQSIYNFLVTKNVENGKLEYLKNKRFGVLGYSPLAQGILTAKYKYGIPKDSRIAKANELGYDKTKLFLDQYPKRLSDFYKIVENNSFIPAHFALSWLVDIGVIPTIGARNVEQFKQCLNYIENPIDARKYI